MRAAHPAEPAKPGDPVEADESPSQIEGRTQAPEGWHHVAALWYDSLLTSGQSVFYESSDWALAYVLAESMSRELNPQKVDVTDSEGVTTIVEIERPPKGASLAAWLKGMSSLLVAEGDRRRMQIELQRPSDPNGESGGSNVSSITAWQSRIDGTG